MPEISSVHLSEILKINTEIDKDVKQLINHYLTHFHYVVGIELKEP